MTSVQPQKATAVKLIDRELFEILRLIKTHTGISMDESKRDLIARRLGVRLKALKLPNYKAYIDYLAGNSTSELEQFTNAVTTNLTAFFREGHHFDTLKKEVIPEIIEKGSTRLKIWSAGCSSGEEPYSIAMTLIDTIPNLPVWDAKILATDIDSEMIERCSKGCYARDNLNNLTPDLLSKHFLKGVINGRQMVKLKSDVRELIIFRKLNLMDQWPFKNQFDVIFCRNVLIYFDRPTQNNLINRFADQISSGGYLIIGHSERIMNHEERFEFLGHTVYKKL